MLSWTLVFQCSHCPINGQGLQWPGSRHSWGWAHARSLTKKRWGWGTKGVRAHGQGNIRRLRASRVNVANPLQSEPEHYPPTSASSLLPCPVNHTPPTMPHGSLNTWQLFIWDQKPRTSRTWLGTQRTRVGDSAPCEHRSTLIFKGWFQVRDQTVLPTLTPQWYSVWGQLDVPGRPAHKVTPAILQLFPNPPSNPPSTSVFPRVSHHSPHSPFLFNDPPSPPPSRHTHTHTYSFRPHISHRLSIL